MEGPFYYSKFVTGKQNFGRKKDADILSNLLTGGESVVIYEPAKTGKMSLIKQTFYNMRMAGVQVNVGECSLLECRTREQLLTKIGDTVMKMFADTPEEFAALVEAGLPGTHFVFDTERYSTGGHILSLNWDLDDDDARAIYSLPSRLALAKGGKCVLLINEFQNIMLTEKGEEECKLLEKTVKSFDKETRQCFSFLFCGSRVNAMKEIFETKKFFYRNVTHLALEPIDSRDIIENTIKGFLISGKVMDRELMLGVCKLFRNNIGYIRHFTSICDSLSRGYISEPVLIEALDAMISIHEPRFVATVNELTTFQLSLLKAIIDGNEKFSTVEIIEKYGLNSSANVRRLKDALCKKEIVTFDEDEKATIIDPLFEYWVGKYFFGK